MTHTVRNYIVNADHDSAAYAMTNVMVEVSGDTDEGFYASAAAVGVGHTRATPEDAIVDLVFYAGCVFRSAVESIDMLAPALADFPAFAVYATPSDRVWLHGDSVMVRHTIRGKDQWREHMFGTLFGYCGRDAAKFARSYARAANYGHDTVWCNACGASITAWKRDKRHLYGLSFGDVVNLEGELYKLARAPNDNVQLIAV